MYYSFKNRISYLRELKFCWVPLILRLEFLFEEEVGDATECLRLEICEPNPSKFSDCLNIYFYVFCCFRIWILFAILSRALNRI